MRTWGERFGLLPLDEEQTFLEGLRPTAGRGRILTAFAIQATLEEKIGRPVSEDYLYDLLHRHGWRKVMPRPHHPKADKEQQEDFKENFRSWWQPPPLAVA
jgi:transposase